MDLDLEKKFTINLDDSTKISANIIINFEYMNNKYCIYSINNDNEVNIYCAKNIDGNLIKITNKEEKDFAQTVTNKIVNAIKER